MRGYKNVNNAILSCCFSYIENDHLLFAKQDHPYLILYNQKVPVFLLSPMNELQMFCIGVLLSFSGFIISSHENTNIDETYNLAEQKNKCLKTAPFCLTFANLYWTTVTPVSAAIKNFRWSHHLLSWILVSTNLKIATPFLL